MKTLLILAALVAVACAITIDDSEVHEQWNNFKATHGKTYKDEAEEAYRKKIFKEKLVKIAKHNARYENGEVTFTMGINKHSDLLSHEVKEMLNGHRQGHGKAATSTFNGEGVTFPWPWSKTVDWSKKGYVTPIKDQGQCGSCWAFSTTGALEGQLFKKTKKLVSLSEQQLVDCSSNEKYGNEGCNGGLEEEATLYIRDNGGVDTEESYPYTAQDGTCAYDSANIGGTATGYVAIKKGSEDALKAAVKKIGPISIAIDASWDSFQSYSSGVYYEENCSTSDLDHAVLAVGYGTEKGQDYWLVKNSWGTSWGEEGYIKMARNKNNNCGIATEAIYPTV